MTDRDPRTRIIALMNQKGGVGKTTTTVNLGAALARAGARVLLVDLDPQAHLSLHLGVDPAQLETSIYDLLIDPDADAAGLVRTADENLDVLPAEVDLAAAEQELTERPDRQEILRTKLQAISGSYDFVLLDCPPSLGLLTVNALVAAGEVIVPMQAHFLALQGLSKLLETVQLVRQNMNTALKVSGVILCLHDGHTNLAAEVVEDLQQFFAASRKLAMPWSQALVYDPPVRRNIKLAECPSFGQTIFQYEPACPGAGDYAQLAQAIRQAPAPSTEGDEADSADHGCDDLAPPIHIESSSPAPAPAQAAGTG
ncbi:MAG: AAA family ATPase, partial [Phycisphaerae bacterium]|nr:AAA family ATPase [Phycisphaerae bacterium]